MAGYFLSLIWCTYIGMVLLKTTLGSKSSGYIKSPNYPNNYPNNENRTWLIQLPPEDAAKTIRLELRYFHTESKQDKLTVFDLQHGSMKKLGVIHGSARAVIWDNSQQYFYTYTNHVMLMFTTNSAVTYKGFDIEWQAITQSFVKNDTIIIPASGVDFTISSSGIRGWVQAKGDDDDFDWAFTNTCSCTLPVTTPWTRGHSTRMLSCGPDNYYAYSRRKLNESHAEQRFVIFTPNSYSSPSGCVQVYFWYCDMGSVLGDLKFVYIDDRDQLLRNSINGWSAPSKQSSAQTSNSWEPEDFTLTYYKTSYLAFVGTIGYHNNRQDYYGRYGDFAVSDIQVKDCYFADVEPSESDTAGSSMTTPSSYGDRRDTHDTYGNNGRYNYTYSSFNPKYLIAIVPGLLIFVVIVLFCIWNRKKPRATENESRPPSSLCKDLPRCSFSSDSLSCFCNCGFGTGDDERTMTIRFGRSSEQLVLPRYDDLMQATDLGDGATGPFEDSTLPKYDEIEHCVKSPEVEAADDDDNDPTPQSV